MGWYIVFLLSCVLCGVGAKNCRGEEARERGSCENLCDDKGNCTVRAALLLPRNTSYDVSMSIVEPTIELALQQEAVKQAFPDWVNFEWMSYDVEDCDMAYAVISAIDAYNDCAHVFFGPSCDFALASVGRIVKFLGSTGTPMLTTGGFSFDFVEPKQNCSSEFYMLVRAGPVGFKDLALFLIDLLGNFNWRKLLLITEPEAQVSVAGKSSCLLMMKSLANYLKKKEIIYTPWDTTSDAGLNYTENLKIYLGNKYTSPEELLTVSIDADVSEHEPTPSAAEPTAQAEAGAGPQDGTADHGASAAAAAPDPSPTETDLDSDLLSALGELPSNDPDFGEKIHENLAKLWLPLLKKGMSKEIKEKIIQEYLIPDNCRLLQAPKLNPEIAAAVPEMVRNRDKNLTIYQQQLGSGLTAINRGLDLLVKSDDKVQAVKHISNGCRVLADLHFTDTQNRIKLLTPSLDKTFLHVIHDAERDETLFGNKLSDKIKASKVIEKQGLQIKKFVKNTKASTPAQPTGSRQAYQGNWTAPPPPRYPSNRGGRGGARKPAPARRPYTPRPKTSFPDKTRAPAQQ